MTKFRRLQPPLQRCFSTSKLKLPVSQETWDCVSQVQSAIEPDNRIDPSIPTKSDKLDLEDLDWGEVKRLACFDVSDYCVNQPWVDPRNGTRHHILAVNSFSNRSPDLVINAIDALRPSCLTLQAPRDTRISELVKDQLDYVDSKSTGLSFANEIQRIAQNTTIEELQTQQFLNEDIDYPLDEILTARSCLMNSHWVTTAWASRVLDIELVFTYLPLQSFIMWRNFFDKNGEPCAPPDSGASEVAFDLSYRASLLERVEFESHLEHAQLALDALEPPSLAFGNLTSQLNELFDPSLHMLQEKACAFYSAGHIIDTAKQYPNKTILHIVQNNYIREFLKALEIVQCLPTDFQRCMEQNGSGAFWRAWKEMGGTQASFVNTEIFTSAANLKDPIRNRSTENPNRGLFASDFEAAASLKGVSLDE